MKFLISFIFLLSLCCYASAKDCDFVSKKSLCGVSLTDPPTSFVNIIGEPSLEIKINDKQTAYAYISQKNNNVFMLIFTDKLLQEVRAWETNANIDFWHYAQPTEEINLLIGGVKFLGRLRGNEKNLDKKFSLLDADQFGQNINYSGTHFSLTYLPFYGPSSFSNTDMNDYEKVQCSGLIIENINRKL